METGNWKQQTDPPAATPRRERIVRLGNEARRSATKYAPPTAVAVCRRHHYLLLSLLRKETEKSGGDRPLLLTSTVIGVVITTPTAAVSSPEARVSSWLLFGGPIVLVRGSWRCRFFRPPPVSHSCLLACLVLPPLSVSLPCPFLDPFLF